VTHRDNDTHKQLKATNRDIQQRHKNQKATNSDTTATTSDSLATQQPPKKTKETFRDNLATLETKRDI